MAWGLLYQKHGKMGVVAENLLLPGQEVFLDW